MRYKYIIPMDIINPNILEPGEVLKYITNEIVPNVYPYYMISSSGRVYHRYMESFMSPGLETSGYLFISLMTSFGPKIVQMNRLVLMAFRPIQNPDLYQANHIDGNKLNNHLYNLEWTTRSENQIHAYRTGLHKPSNITISEEQAKEIVELLKTNHYQCKEIAKIIGVNVNIVNSIKKKESWKHLTTNLDFNSRLGVKYTDDEIHKLCKYFQDNPKPDCMNIKDYVLKALIDCGFQDPTSKVETIRRVYTKRHYTRISKYYNF